MHLGPSPSLKHIREVQTVSVVFHRARVVCIKHKSDQVVHEMEKEGVTHAKQAWLSGNTGVRELAVIQLVCVSTELVTFCFQETWILALRLFLQVLSQLVNSIKIKKSGMDLVWKQYSCTQGKLSDWSQLPVKVPNCSLVSDNYYTTSPTQFLEEGMVC